MKNDNKENKALSQTSVMQSVIVTELRLGNLVECFGIREVVAIKKHKIKVQNESEKGNFILEWCPVNSLSLEPILLTNEWLIKLGFEWSIPHQAYFKNGFDYVIDFYETYPNIEGCLAFINKHHRSGEKLITIKFVHQLQNLYFALTQRELTVA